MRLSDNTTDFITPDFVPRAYTKPVRQLIFFYAMAVLAILLTDYYSHLLGSGVGSGIMLLVLIALAAYTLWYRQQHTDQMMATEFENLLFSAAASLGSSFCMFLKNNGTVVYANDGTRRMFPRVGYDESRVLDQLLEQGKVSKIDQDKLYSALARSQKESLVFSIADAKGERRDFIVMIEPLKRPAGYFVLRGREYYTERKAVAKLTGRLHTTTPEKIGVLLQEIPYPLYITNSSGVLEYTNPALEQVVGYGENEIVEQGLSLQKLIYHADGYETGEFDMVNFSGSVLLSCRNGSLAKGQLSQMLCYDDAGQVTGCCGMVFV